MNSHLKQLIDLSIVDKDIDAFEPQIEEANYKYEAALAQKQSIDSDIENLTIEIKDEKFKKQKNELHLAELSQKLEENSKYDKINIRKKESTIYSIIENKSILFYLKRTIEGMIKAKYYKVGHHKVSFDTQKWTKQGLLSKTQYNSLLENKIYHYKIRLNKMLELASKYNSTLILVTQRFFDYKKINNEIFGVEDVDKYDNNDYNGVDKYYMMQYFNNATLEVCNNFNAICINLADELQFKQGDYYDYVHNTPSGASRIGNYLFKKLKNNF